MNALLVFVALAKAAAPPHYCDPPDAVRAQAQICENNDLFAKRGSACRDSLKAEIAKEGALLRGQLAATESAKQSGHLESASTDYATSSAHLAELLGLADLAIGDVRAYLADFALPEDAYQPRITGASPRGNAQLASCYKRPRKSLKKVLADLETERASLAAAKSASDARMGKSRFRKNGLTGGNAPALSGRGAGSGTKTGPATNGASTITGVEDDKAKRKK